MITLESLMEIQKDDIQSAAKALESEDIALLVDFLSLKDDNARYKAFLLLQSRSELKADVYPYWNAFSQKLKSDNSYQRSIGIMLLAENARWDTGGKTKKELEGFFALLNDEKPITIRQCIQSLKKVAELKPETGETIASRLMALDLSAIRESMRKSILTDILDALVSIRKTTTSDRLEEYILSALSGQMLDKKAKKQIEAQLAAQSL